METIDRVKRVASNYSGVGLDDIGDDASFEQLGLDSLDELQAIMDIEAEFDIFVPDDEAEKMLSISHVVSFLDEHGAG